MKVLCVGYRDWALRIYSELTNSLGDIHDFKIINSKEKYSEQAVIDYNPDLSLYYGWSWMIPESITARYKSIMLHPSPLPKYRGGSPIQNQIINNEKSSCVTLFIITNEVDAGDIVGQEAVSLEGHLNEIFDRIIQKGIKLTTDLLQGQHQTIQQDHTKATIYKRRTPEQSELTIEELQNQDSEYLFNKIRMLEDPYPNAYIRTVDGKKLLIKLAEIQDE